MSLLSFCQWIQTTGSSTWLHESTWGFPIISAIHVLGIAWFGGTVLIPDLGRQLRLFRRAGLALVVLTGVLLFWIEPVKCFNSVPFRIKLASFFILAVSLPWRTRLSTILSWVIWLAVIFASRWIAYF